MAPSFANPFSWFCGCCVWLWNVVLVQLMAESLWDIVADCVVCVHAIPVSVQVIASSCLGDVAPNGCTGETAVSADASAVEASRREGPDCAGKPGHDGDASFLWVHHSLVSGAEARKTRSSVQRQVGMWMPLTVASVGPNGNPPRWPQRSGGNTTKGLAGKRGLGNNPGGVRNICGDTQLSSGVVPSSSGSAVRGRHKVLVLDLDETLVFTNTSTAKVLVPPHFSEAIPTMGGAELFHVWERPYLQLFLDAVSRVYNVVVFTAAAPAYADPILDRIDRRKRIKRRLYRRDCTSVHQPNVDVSSNPPDDEAHALSTPTGAPQRPNKWLAKDLAVLGVPLSHVLLVDNTRCCGVLNPDNCIIVPSYAPPRSSAGIKSGAGDHLAAVDPDDVLLGLIPFLEALSCVADVRPIIARSTVPHSD